MQLGTPGAAGEWVALGVSVAGTSHVARDLRCQDAHAGVVLEDGTLLLAVADGAGSATFAGEGAVCASQTAVGYLASALASEHPANEEAWRALLTSTLDRVRAMIAALAEEKQGTTARDFATTLLVAVVTRETVGTLQIGDGAIVLRAGSALHVLSPATEREYVNETTFVTSEDASERALVAVNASEPVDGVAMVTDGVQFLAIETRSNSAHAGFFTPLFAFAADPEADPGELSAMLSTDRVNERTDDDKTLVLAVRLDRSPAEA